MVRMRATFELGDYKVELDCTVVSVHKKLGGWWSSVDDLWKRSNSEEGAFEYFSRCVLHVLYKTKESYVSTTASLGA